MSNSHSQSHILLIHGLAGAVSGSCSTLLLYPLENIKTRMQVLHMELNKKPKEEKKDIENQVKDEEEVNKKPLGLSELIKKVFEEEGILGFYSGVTPLCVGSFISYGVYFSAYEFLKRFFEKRFQLKQTDLKSYIITSFIAGCMTSVATNPFWIVNAKMTVDKEGRGVRQIVKQLIADEGIKGLLKGLKASLVLVANPIIQFVIYENLKKRNKTQKHLSAVLSFLYGALSKAIATLATFPYQVIRTNIQLEKDKHFLEIINMIYKRNGLKGYFRGLTPKLTQTVINSAIMLTLYEKILLLVKKVIDRLAEDAKALKN